LGHVAGRQADALEPVRIERKRQGSYNPRLTRS
jgi:hypothetical protein